MSQFSKKLVLYLLIIAIAVFAIDSLAGQNTNKAEMSYTGFVQQVQQKKVESVTITNDHGIKGKLKNGTDFVSYAPSDDTLIKTLTDNGVEITAAPPEQPSWWVSLLGSAIPIIILVVVFFFIMQQTQGGGGRVMNFGKSRAKMMGDGNVKVKFSDVAGAEEAKQELTEVVEFLKDPGKFTSIGATIPKGVLLAGPPGTGKTLLAKAVAGEAGVPFFTISGSDFIEMFVGVGASRVRDLFGQALNQLLVEMDGFGANEGIITLAATNRPDILDPALLRPGRFDRQVVVGRPDLHGREAILKVHARNKPLADDVDLKTIAKKTPGFTGADLSNLLNEAALLAARLNKKVITMAELEEASEKVSMGPERRSHIVSEKDRKLTAYHESGDAIVAHLLPHANPVHKVTIIPRGYAGGYTMMLPKEDHDYKTKAQLLADIRVALGGRIAEALVLGDISTGASGDLQSVTNTARSMVTRWGMSDTLGPIVFGEQQEQVFLGKNIGHERNYSEEVASKIDVEIHHIVDEAYRDVEQLLTDNMDFLHNMAKALLEEETIDAKAVENLHKYGTTKAPDETEAPTASHMDAVISMPNATEETKTSSTESDVQS